MLWFSPVSRSSRLALGVALSATVALSCGQTKHPPAFDLPQGGNGAGGSGGDGVGGLVLGDGGMDSAFCGNQQIPAVTNPPNLYFIVDRSGSMSDNLPGSGYSKYENARVAISKMLRAIGHRVRYGAGVFPAFTGSDGCEPGLQIFPTVAGDPPTFAESMLEQLEAVLEKSRSEPFKHAAKLWLHDAVRERRPGYQAAFKLLRSAP